MSSRGWSKIAAFFEIFTHLLRMVHELLAGQVAKISSYLVKDQGFFVSCETVNSYWEMV